VKHVPVLYEDMPDCSFAKHLVKSLCHCRTFNPEIFTIAPSTLIIMTASAPHADNVAQEFTKHWQNATADSNLTLHGFRRFKTSHLINLRYLEEEMAVLDNVIYEAGLSLDLSPSSEDRLALRYRKRDKNAPLIEETITRETILKLRSLIKEYGLYLSLSL